MRLAPLALLTLLLFAWPAQAQPDPMHHARSFVTDTPFFAGRSPVIAQHGMAATSQPLATQVALSILRAGGTAVDAALAANAALGLMEPTGCGIGGDLFAIVYDPATQALYGLNASGRAPSGQSLADLQARLGDTDAIPAWGSLSVSVPGAVDGWFMLHERFGRLPMADLLAPAIGYAREGFPVSPVIASLWAMNVDRFARNADVIEEMDNYAATYLIDGQAPAAGQLFRNPDLADTYALLATHGRDAFYEGPIADAIDAYMRRIGGPLRKADLQAHRSDWVTPLTTNYRGYDVYELPPNGQGLAALQMLNILEGYDLASMGYGSADYLHLQAEAKKLAFEDRARYYADPAFYDAPLDLLLSKDYAASRRRMIHPEKALQQLLVMDERIEDGDTIYLTVADSSGMMVSLIQSNYMGLGSGLVPDGLGFMLQDRGALFALDASHANVYAPGKRPFHTIIPAFVMKDGKPFLSFGLMGGAMQPQGHVQILSNIIDFGMDLQAAGDAVRYRHIGSSQPTGRQMTSGGTLQLEPGLPPAVLDELRRRGHHVEVTTGAFGGYQAILWDAVHQVYQGASELRKDGQAAGY